MNCINCGRDVSNPAERVAGDFKPMCLHCFNRGLLPLSTPQPSPIPDFCAQPEDGLAPRAMSPAPLGSGGVKRRGGKREGAGRKSKRVATGKGASVSFHIVAELHADVLKYQSNTGQTMSKCLAQLVEIGLKHARIDDKQLNKSE